MMVRCLDPLAGMPQPRDVYSLFEHYGALNVMIYLAATNGTVLPFDPTVELAKARDDVIAAVLAEAGD